MTTYQSSLEFAQDLDKKDTLSGYRSKFHIPTLGKEEQSLYFCGNSLGLQPKAVQESINQELIDWADLGVEGHFEAQNPWMPYHEFLTDAMAKVVGAKPAEVVVMNTLTVNLHLGMVSFYRPTEKRFKIIIEKDVFPSDKYAVESQVKAYGFDPKEAIVYWSPNQETELLELETLKSLVDDSVALILVGGVNYYTGQFLDLKQIADVGHQVGAKVGIDLAHGAGNIKPELHNSGVDFAVWCTYKYLNSGPGSVGGFFVHERHLENKEINRFAGWWGHNKSTRFNMRQEFDPIPTAEAWQLSNPPILSLAAIKSSLAIFDEVGMDALREKSEELTGYLEFLLKELGEDQIRVITPSNPKERGCQLSVQVKNANRALFDKLRENHIIADWREPDVIRLAPVPLYNTFEEVYRLVQKLKSLING